MKIKLYIYVYIYIYIYIYISVSRTMNYLLNLTIILPVVVEFFHTCVDWKWTENAILYVLRRVRPTNTPENSHMEEY